MPMNPEIKVKWVKALRSGRYKQTTGALYDGGGHCCLGVLCRTLRAKLIYDRSVRYFDWRGDQAADLLPKSLLRHVGISHAEQHELAQMNDDGQTFADISDYIERRL